MSVSSTGRWWDLPNCFCPIHHSLLYSSYYTLYVSTLTTAESMYYSSKWSTEWFQEFLSCDVSMILRTLILSIHRPHGIWICRSGHFTRSYSYDLITGICSNILGTLGTLTVSGRGFFPDWISRIYVFRVSSFHRFNDVLYWMNINNQSIQPTYQLVSSKYSLAESSHLGFNRSWSKHQFLEHNELRTISLLRQ